MLLIPAAFAAHLDAPKLLRAAAKGKDASTWFDADAAFVFEQRAGFAASSFDLGTKGRRLRDLLEDADARRLDTDTIAQGGSEAVVGCKAGAASRQWTASAGAAPEIVQVWPARASLHELAVVPLTCPASTGPTALGLTHDGAEGWRIAAFLDTKGVADWTTFADEVARDVPKERADERARLTAELRAAIVTWSPPTLPVVQRNRDDIDGDGLADFGVAGTHLYRSTTKVPERISGAAKVIVAGDVDGDGVGDVLVDLGGQLQVRFGGDVARSMLLQDGPRSSGKWLAADLDGDGRADLVEVQSGGVRVWFDGKPYLGASLTLPAVAEATAPAVDLDGDGIDDLAIGMPAYGDQRGGVLIIHGVRGSPMPRTTGFVGDYKERLGERLSATEAGVLVGVSGRLRTTARVDLWGGDGRLARQDVAPGLLVDQCTGILAGPETGEVVAVCRSKLRRHGADGVRELVFSGLNGAAPVRTPEGGRILAWTTSSFRLVGGADWVAGPTIPLPPPPPSSPESSDGVVGGVLGGVIGGVVGGATRDTSADGSKVVHWSEVQAKRRATPRFVPLPEGLTEDRCIVRIFLDEAGAPQRVEFKACPTYLQEATRDAVMAAAWYPFRPPQPVHFDLTFTYRAK